MTKKHIYATADYLPWNTMMIIGDSFSLNEKKTGKHREIKVNSGLRDHLKDCFGVWKIKDSKEKCFLNKYSDVISIQRVNEILKEINVKYGLVGINHFYTHSFRKTFGRKVVEMARDNSETSLIKLSEIFNHPSATITRRYLGFRHQESQEVYESLSL